ncbi:MAG TPA: hypothetical protein VMX58_06250 [Patescibacteria group bacterium]|nr:hypothetical protein [Patescibacteria group bacterium]
MSGTIKVTILCGMLVVMMTGCFPPGGEIIGTMTAGVDRIPTTLGLYPLLSTPIQAYVGRYSDIVRHRETLAVKRRMPDNVVIVPPAESDLMVTGESQILTGLVSMQLSTFGFSLKELPVEVPATDDDRYGEGDDDHRFVISLNLLERLREDYGVRALVVGSAFFITEMGHGLPPEQRVISAHLKVVDIATLDVLGQVNLTYDAYGVDMNVVSEMIAEELAYMAGLGGGKEAE